MPKDNCTKKHAHENAPIIKIRSGYGRVQLSPCLSLSLARSTRRGGCVF